MNNRTSQKNKWITQINEMMSMPFVRIDLILDMEHEEIIQTLAKWQSSRTGITNYQTYC